MTIQTTVDRYKSLGNYFAPDYKQDNEVLEEFKRNNPLLSKRQVNELVDLLKTSNDITDKYFVADLLYLYDKFDRELLEPLLETAISHKDPSFNRIFLRPCLTAFGIKAVAAALTDKFNQGTIDERIGISNLIYWLRPRGEAGSLHQAILEKAKKTTNLIELYHYKLCYPDEIENSNKIPNSADELVKVIKGNKEYEDLLFATLGWTKNNGC
ncbi:MAG TPA: hypothetical protein VF540_09455 [Segetibacter sp.]|jgi:hypothetical protein